MRKRRNDFFDKSWVTIATIVGIIAVVAIALVFFWGNGGSTGTPSSGQAAAGTVTAVPTTSAGSAAVPVTVRQTTTVSVPETGAYLTVSYIGSFSGTYGTSGMMEKVRASGDRVYPLNTGNGTISAVFRKEDGSTKHDLAVELWKDGKVLKSADNSSAYGLVSLSYQP